LSAESRIVVHLSDLHFGREDARAVSALPDAVRAVSPDVIAISGDLTQRARRAQFRRAREFLDALPVPQLIVPGNHDVPLFNVLARTLRPLGGYRRHITTDLQPMLSDGPLWIMGINTTRASAWKSGRVRPEAIARLRDAIRHAPADSIRILVAHHPFDAATGKTGDPLAALTDAGIDVFLTGHLHASYAGHTAQRYQAAGRTAVVVEAGTATSTRLRTEANAFNVLRVTRDAIDVAAHIFERTAFVSGAAQRFSRTASGWTQG
jgi:3',5'-cyclic AMP phosphodiesterase CpdA